MSKHSCFLFVTANLSCLVCHTARPSTSVQLACTSCAALVAHLAVVQFWRSMPRGKQLTVPELQTTGAASFFPSSHHCVYDKVGPSTRRYIPSPSMTRLQWKQTSPNSWEWRQETNGEGSSCIRIVFCFFGFFFFFWFFGFFETGFLCSLGCPGTHSVDQAGLELRNPPASASQVLGLKACAATARLTLEMGTADTQRTQVRQCAPWVHIQHV
jgi:hypothetical protein